MEPWIFVFGPLEHFGTNSDRGSRPISFLLESSAGHSLYRGRKLIDAPPKGEWRPSFLPSFLAVSHSGLGRSFWAD